MILLRLLGFENVRPIEGGYLAYQQSLGRVNPAGEREHESAPDASGEERPEEEDMGC